MIEVYLIPIDSGDGSTYPTWFKNKDILDKVKEKFPEEAWMGYTALQFPEGLDFKSCGVTFADAEWAERLNDGIV